MSTLAPIVSLIQARMSSSRLQGKSLLPLGTRTVLDHVIDRAAQFSAQVVVCTSTDASDDAIASHCERRGVTCVRGALDDVFARFRAALRDPRVARTAWFARVTADCPLLSVPLAQSLISAIAHDLDYVTVDPATLPRGLGIELVRRGAFESIPLDSLDAAEREHVTLRLYEHPGRYICQTVPAPLELCHPELRLTLDYPDDYALLCRLLAEDDALTAERAVERLLDDAELRSLNAACDQRSARSSDQESSVKDGARA